jgi:hypothetical protein
MLDGCNVVWCRSSTTYRYVMCGNEYHFIDEEIY